MSGVSRRSALRIGALTVGGALLFGRGASAFVERRLGGQTTPPRGDELVPIPELTSVDGVLAVATTAQMGDAIIDGQVVGSTWTYDGSYPGRTWRIRPGDVFRVQLTNQLDTFTNLHWHGMHVSPQDNGDNVLIQINPGETFDYEVAVPADHPSGLYWYHPHYHTTVNEQVYGGMAGMIVVDGGWSELPGIAEASEHLMAIMSVVVDDGAVAAETLPDVSNEVWTINGQLNPTITVRPGERQLWRIANISNDGFFRLALDGHEMIVVATDGNGVPATFAVSEYILPPAGRVEVLIEPSAPGTYALQSLQTDQGFITFDQRTLATMVVEGEPAGALPPIPSSTIDTLEDLRQSEPDQYRTFTFDHDEIVTTDGLSQNTLWCILGQTFNEARVDVVAQLGAMEEWTLTNYDDEDHPFHIHQNDFQVVEINGVPQDFIGHRDTVTIPRGGTVKIRQRFEDYTGTWVFHCHILKHEDHGMMMVIEVVEPS